jgi:hypothetical protein
LWHPFRDICLKILLRGHDCQDGFEIVIVLYFIPALVATSASLQDPILTFLPLVDRDWKHHSPAFRGTVLRKMVHQGRMAV